MGLAEAEVCRICEFSPLMLVSPLECKLLQDKRCVSFAHCWTAIPSTVPGPQCSHLLSRMPHWGLLRDGWMGSPDCRFWRVSCSRLNFQLGNAASLWPCAVIRASEGCGELQDPGAASGQVTFPQVHGEWLWFLLVCFILLFLTYSMKNILGTGFIVGTRDATHTHVLARRNSVKISPIPRLVLCMLWVPHITEGKWLSVHGGRFCWSTSSP